MGIVVYYLRDENGKTLGDPMDREYPDVLNFRVRPAQRALIDAAVELSGYRSRSAAAREVLVDWARKVYRKQLREAMGAGEDADQVDFSDEMEELTPA